MPDHPGANGYEALDRIVVRLICVVNGHLVSGGEPPGFVQICSGIVELPKGGHDLRIVRQDPKTSVGKTKGQPIPFTHYVAGHLVTLLPDPTLEVFRQRDDQGELL